MDGASKDPLQPISEKLESYLRKTHLLEDFLPHAPSKANGATASPCKEALQSEARCDGVEKEPGNIPHTLENLMVKWEYREQVEAAARGGQT